MEHQQPEYPKARQSDVLVEKMGDETILYDGQRQLAHSLNRSASIVWENSDGEHSVSALAQLVGAELGIEPNDSVVEYALDKLASANLLEDNQVSRRDVVRRMTLAGVAALALPVVLSVAAPTEAMAASGQNSQGQNNNKQG
jgi:hypothetical protein